jgi:hypothetical protein
MKNTPLLFAASASLLAATFTLPCEAQTSAPQFARVTVTHVKPDMLNEWLDLQKNVVVPALKKAGLKTRTVYSNGLFGNAYEYTIVTPFEKYAEFDEPNPMIRALGQPAAARLNEKTRKCVVSSNSYSITRLADLSNTLEGAQPAIVVSARYRIAPGKMTEFENLVKFDVLPVYKKGKTGLLVFRRGPGANTNDVTLNTLYSKYADLDGGPFLTKQLGQDAAGRINAKFTGIRTMVEVVVRFRVADLSF